MLFEKAGGFDLSYIYGLSVCGADDFNLFKFQSINQCKGFSAFNFSTEIKPFKTKIHKRFTNLTARAFTFHATGLLRLKSTTDMINSMTPAT